MGAMSLALTSNVDCSSDVNSSGGVSWCSYDKLLPTPLQALLHRLRSPASPRGLRIGTP